PNNQYPITNNYLYSTGDRVRWLPDGTIEFLGRYDFQVKIRGYRIELGEIENQLLTHEDVKEVVVAARDTAKAEKYLCAYVVSHKFVSSTELRTYLTGKLPEYMVPTYFVPIETIPLNPNGKVDLRALPEPETGSTGIEYIAPGDQLEEKLVHIWSEILNIEHGKISIKSNFFEVGGHSLKATLLMTRIYKELEVKLSLEEIFKTLTVKQQAEAVRNKKKEKYITIDPADKKKYYNLSSA
ncbi:MAG: non-ribosomal peptide synthetase, partial [bacterium]|nr:non-ribosomal peptide synthetase [bacterium]